MKYRILIIIMIVASVSIFAQQESVSKVLEKAGTIIPGSAGSYTTEGFEMSLGENNEPVFNKINSLQKTTTFSWNAVTGGGINGVNGTVHAIAVSGTDVYVGGAFTFLGNGTTSANNIAKWNGSSWSVLQVGGSDGVNNTVKAIVISGTDVYVGGYFTAFGDGTPVNHVAKWNGSNWSILGSIGSDGVISNVYAMALSGSDIYVGGTFTSLGDNSTSAKNIAKWDGSNWSVLGSGSNNGIGSGVLAIAISGTDVYVGGVFTTLGDGSSAKYIAKWDGNAWTSLTSGASNGVNNNVWALTSDGTNIYVGGQFTVLGDGATIANYIAKWNGSTWSTLGSGPTNGVGGLVNAIATSGTDVYAGGGFLTLGTGTSAKYIAKWDGASWSTVGNGSNDVINSLRVNPAEGLMYLGGGFTMLNNETGANYVGTLADSHNPLPVELTSFSASLSESNVKIEWKTATETNNYGFEVERKAHPNHSQGEELSDWKAVGFVKGNGNSNSPKEYSFVDGDVTSNRNYSYRLKQIDIDGHFKYSEEIEVSFSSPKNFELSQNYPNPFNPSTSIWFSLPTQSNVKIEIFNMLGQKVAELFNEQLGAGYHEKIWDANVASGVYMYRIEAVAENNPANRFVMLKKALLLK